MSVLQMTLLTPISSRNLSSVRVLSGSDQTDLISQISRLSIQTTIFPANSSVIRMGGGPRTYPGGVSKWQWKRMQAKKAKQLLKARLCRERQIYEMRKRAELRAAVSELERPWEVVERVPTLFSVKADEQLKALADRFQRPGGYDLWSEKDGPELFKTHDGLPSARFFPKGVVHSVKPYGRITDSCSSGTLKIDEELGLSGSVAEVGIGGSIVKGGRNGSRRSKKSSNGRGRGRGRRGSDNEGEFESRDLVSSGENQIAENSYSKNSRISYSRGKRVANNGGGTVRGSSRGGLRNKGNGRNTGSGNSYQLDSEQYRFGTEEREPNLLPQRGRNGGSPGQYNTRMVSWKPRLSHSGEVYDMNLKQDGSYEFETNRQKNGMNVGSEDAFQLDLY